MSQPLNRTNNTEINNIKREKQSDLKRPLFFFVFCYLLGIIFAKNFDISFYIHSGVLLIIAFSIYFVLYVTDKRKYIAVALIPMFFCGAMRFYEYAPIKPTDEEKLIHARVLSVKEYDYTNKYTVKSDFYDSKLYLYSNVDLERDDEIEFKAKIEPLEKQRNFGGFDSYVYSLSNGVKYSAKTNDIKLTGKAEDFTSYMNVIREKLSILMDEIYPEDSGLLKMILFGIEEDIPKELYAKYKASEMTQVLVISGQHISLLAAIAAFMSLKLGIPKVLKYLLIEAMFTLFAFLTDFSPSCMRAVIAYSFYEISLLFNKKPDAITALAVSAFLPSLINPYGIFSLSFQLSYGISFALIISNGKHVNGLKDSLLNGFISSLVSSVIIINPINRITPFAFISNTLANPIMVILIPLLGASVVMYAIFGKAMAWLCWLPNYLASVVTKIAETFSSFPQIPVPSINPLLIILFFVALYICSRYYRHNKKLGLSVVAVLSAVIILTGTFNKNNYSIRISFVDCGAASCAVITTADGNCIMIDTAEKGKATDYMLKNDLKANIAIITHAHDDHAGDAKELYDIGKVNNIYSSESAKAYLMNDFGIDSQSLKKGDIIKLSEDAAIEVLREDNEASKDLNEDSLILLLKYKGEDYCLFTGDAYTAQELEVLDGSITPKFFVMAHHGSNTSAHGAIRGRAKPEYFIISSDMATRKDAQEMAQDIPVLNTCDLGEIRIEIDKNGKERIYSCVKGGY